MLWRKSRRDLLGARWQTGGLALLVAISTGLLLGAVRARQMLAESLDGCLERLNAADLEIRCSPTLPGAVDSVRDTPGVIDAEERMLLDGLLRAEGRPAMPAHARMLRANASPRIYALEVVHGRWPAPGEEGLLIDRSLETVSGLSVGDRLTLEILGASRTLPVLGVTLGSEHALFPVHPDFELPIPGTLAVVQVSAAAAVHFPYADRVDSLLFRIAPDADAQEVERQVLGSLGAAVAGVLTPDTDPAQRVGRSAIDIYGIYMPTSMTVLLSVALALYLITLARLVHMQRRQLGTLLSVGHRKSAITLSLLPLSVLPTAIGFVAGVLLHPGIARRIFDAHIQSLGWAPLVDTGPGPEILHTAVVCIALAVVGCVAPAMAALRQGPSPLLRHDARRVLARSDGLPARIGRFTARILRMPLSVLLGIRAVLRRRWVSAVTALALGANFALVMAFLFVNLSHTIESEASFNRIGLTGIAYFAEPQAEVDLRAAARPDWTEIEPTIAGPAWFDFARGPAFARLICLRPSSWIREFPIAEGEAFVDGSAPVIYFDYWLADEHDIRVGDRIVVYPFYSAPEGVELEVAGIFGGVTLGYAVVSLETGQALFSMPDMVTGLHVESDRPREEVIDALQALPDVESVVHMDDAREHVARTFDGSRYIITITLVFTVMVAVIFLGILASLDAAERSRDLAVLRALGWRGSATLALCVTEVMTRGMFALLLALPAAPLLATWMLHQIREASHYRMPLHDPTWIYLLVAALALLLIPLGALPALRAAKALPTSRVVRLLGSE